MSDRQIADFSFPSARAGFFLFLFFPSYNERQFCLDSPLGSSPFLVRFRGGPVFLPLARRCIIGLRQSPSGDAPLRSALRVSLVADSNSGAGDRDAAPPFVSPPSVDCGRGPPPPFAFACGIVPIFIFSSRVVFLFSDLLFRRLREAWVLLCRGSSYFRTPTLPFHLPPPIEGVFRFATRTSRSFRGSACWALPLSLPSVLRFRDFIRSPVAFFATWRL